jgi:pimeloyl-ACP methyl ester carboxylesterase
MATYVIVHGGWSGGWYFQESARLMRAAGHEVYTPTLTGIGERVHLGHADIDLNTHIQDITNVLVYEDLHNVLLVGYSYGGMVITGVAEAVPERIGQLIAPLFANTAARVQAEGWRYRELAVDHTAPEDDPHAVADLLLDLA